MLHNKTIGSYYSTNSRIHKMNPLIKIICTFLFVLMVFINNNIKIAILEGVFLILLLLISNVPIKIYLKQVFYLKWIILFLIIVNIILKVDLIITIITILRLIYTILYTSILTFTTTTFDITDGLRKFLSPLKVFKVPVNKMAFMVSLALRFISTITNQGYKIMKSQASRGLDYNNSNLKLKIISIKSLVIPIFNKSIKMADALAETLSLRLYDINKTNYNNHKIKLYDIFILIVHISVLLLVVKEVIL